MVETKVVEKYYCDICGKEVNRKIEFKKKFELVIDIFFDWHTERYNEICIECKEALLGKINELKLER